MKERTLRKIVISGDPFSRGTQYGIKAQDLIEKSISLYKSSFTELSGVDWDRALDFSKTFTRRIKDYDESMIDELKGIAEGSGRTFEEIMVVNIRTEILFGLKQPSSGCTSLCALPDITAEKNTILAQNWDYKPWAMHNNLLLQVNQKDAPDILTLVEAGQFARMGMNSMGHGICNNYIQCEADGKTMETEGIPTTFIRRKALSQERYSDVIGTIIHTPRSFSANYLVATSEGDGDSIDIEATPERVYFLYPADGMLTHANHFKGATPGDFGVIRAGLENSIYRDRRVESILRQKTAALTIENAMEALRDHFGYPDSVCRHPDKAKPVHEQWRTNNSIIMDLKSLVLWASGGPPCQYEYAPYGFESRG